MRKTSKKSLGLLLAAGAVAGALVAPAPASAAVTCGVTVTYGLWKHIPDTATWNRSWTWNFKNCSYNVVKRKVVVNNGPDSSCRSIAYGVISTFKATETNTLGVHTMQYSSTPAC
ncbi:hypothetical protein [Micromonospora vulcania]|uniref:Uncharacterized protein n=1 Tax=Micromonospora vulcania TaxID=1441873 RepID=A0ABW1H0N5_9ACTN